MEYSPCPHPSHMCRWFCFVLFCLIVAFPCRCISLLLPFIHDDVREFLATFGKGERGGVFYIPLSSLKNYRLHLRRPALCSFSTRGYTNNNKNQFSRETIRALVTVQKEYLLNNNICEIEVIVFVKYICVVVLVLWLVSVVFLCCGCCVVVGCRFVVDCCVMLLLICCWVVVLVDLLLWCGCWCPAVMLLL